VNLGLSVVRDLRRGAGVRSVASAETVGLVRAVIGAKADGLGAAIAVGVRLSR
jgi:hypothetical protein